MSGATKLRDLQAGSSGGMMDSTAMETEEYYNQEGGEWSQKVDTGQLCRVCANPNEYLIPIFDGEGLEHELAMKIQKHLPIKVTETDTLPIHICYQCASTLIAWHDLVISCVEADKKLKELQVEDEDDDDDKGAEMFESHSMDSDPADEVDQPSTSEAQSQVTKAPVIKKVTPSKEKKPKLKMVLVKGPPAGTSGQKAGAKSQLVKALEQGKSKEGSNEDSTSERYFRHIPRIGGNVQHEGTEDRTAVLGTNYIKWKKMKLNVDSVSNVKYSNLYEVLFRMKGKLTDNGTEVSNEIRDPSTNDILDVGESGTEENAEWQCVRCDFQKCVSSKIELLRNMKKIGKEETVRKEEETGEWECVRCDMGCNAREETKNSSELKNTHGSTSVAKINTKPFECKYCDACFSSAVELYKHSQYHKDSSLLNCSYCSETFDTDDELNSHLKIHAGDKTLLCHVCGKKFINKSALNQHTQVHGNDQNKPIRTCEKCGKVFRSISNFKNHLVLHTGVKQFVCDKCGKCFYTLTSLNIHLHAHSDEKPFKCSICSQRFRWQKNVKVHEKTHNKEKGKKNTKILCLMCKEELPNKRSIKAHMQLHNIFPVEDKSVIKERKTFTCSICDRQFKGSGCLNYHMKVKHGAEMYGKCYFCEKKFPSKQALENHVRIHTNECPYKCDTCGKEFRSANSHRYHMRIHLGIRPYPCIVCGKRFRKKFDLDCHYRTHTGEKPFACEVCNFSCSQKCTLNKHMFTHRHVSEVQ